MAHKRFVSSGISTDPRFAELCESGPLAPLVYVLCLVHADDWGRITADGRRLKLMLFPTMSVKASEIEEAVQLIASAGLWTLHEKASVRWIQFPEGEWYALQSYIGNRRRSECRSEFPNPDGTMPWLEDEDEKDDTNNSHFLRTSKEIVHSHSHSHSHSDSDSEQGKTRLNAVVVDSGPIDIERLVRMAEEAGIKIKRSELAELARKYGQEWVEDAIAITDNADHPTTRYLMAVLSRWERTGGPDGTYATEASLLAVKKRKNRPPKTQTYGRVIVNEPDPTVEWTKEFLRQHGGDLDAWDSSFENHENGADTARVPYGRVIENTETETARTVAHLMEEVDRKRGMVWERIEPNDNESPEKTHQSAETNAQVSGDRGEGKKPSEGRLEARQEPFDTSKLKIADDLRAFWHDFDMLMRIHGHEKVWQALRELADDGPVTAAALSHKLNHPAKKSG